MKTPSEIDKLYDSSEITLREAAVLRDEWEKASDEERKAVAISAKKGNSSILTDKEIQEKILKNLVSIKKTNQTISTWVSIFAVLYLIGIIILTLFYYNTFTILFQS